VVVWLIVIVPDDFIASNTDAHPPCPISSLTSQLDDPDIAERIRDRLARNIKSCNRIGMLTMSPV
jgi:hypothetical protein